MSASVQRQSPQAQQQQLSGTQVYWVWLARGTMLLAAGGNVRAAPAATAEVAFPPEVSLQEGECLNVERSGWFCLRAGRSPASGSANAAAAVSIASVTYVAPARAGNFLRRLIPVPDRAWIRF